MKRYLIPLLFMPSLVLAQVDPLQRFINEFGAANTAQNHAIESLQPALDQIRKLLMDAEVQKATLIEWLKESQAKEAK